MGIIRKLIVIELLFLCTKLMPVGTPGRLDIAAGALKLSLTEVKRI